MITNLLNDCCIQTLLEAGDIAGSKKKKKKDSLMLLTAPYEVCIDK